MLSETRFDTFVHAFTLKPLLIAGKAMQYYGVRDGQEYEFVLPKEEFRSLRVKGHYDLFTNAFGDVGIRAGEYTFYESAFGFSYFHLERDAVDRQDYLVPHPGMLLFLSIMRLVQEPTVQETQADMLLLMHQLGVLVTDSSEPPAPDDTSLSSPDHEEPWEPIDEVRLTRLEGDLLTLLKEHGCLIQMETPGSSLVRFPAQTCYSVLPTVVHIKRFRIILPDGLELRHESDPPRAMSILYLADLGAQNRRQEE